MKKVLFLILLLVVSCSPQKRLERLVSRNPELKVNDTITIKDTTIIPGINIDTTFIIGKTDTIVFWKDNVQVKFIRHFDTIQTVITRQPDTIIKKINVPVEKIVIENDCFEYWLYVVIAILVFLLFVTLLKK